MVLKGPEGGIDMSYLNHHHHAGERLESPSPSPDEEISTGFSMSKESMEQFLENCRQSGFPDKKTQRYANGLNKLYDYLPKDKKIRHGTLREWRDSLVNKGYVHASVNNFLMIANRYLDFSGQQEYQMFDRLENLMEAQPELSRNEYLRLLKTAKQCGNDRAYFLIKVIGTTGLASQELPKVTVEAVKAGKLIMDYHSHKYIFRIPEILQNELLDYIERHGIQTGPVFAGRGTNPLSRVHVFRIIRSICVAAGIPEEKGTALCVRKVYRAKQIELENNVKVLIDQAYNRLLEEEQLEIGWTEM